MKTFLAGIFLLIIGFANSQTTAYTGENDLKAQLGADLQRKNALGAVATIDYGLSEYFSVGLQSAYIFKAKEIDGTPLQFKDRFDAKIRLSASLGDTFRFPENMDFYPGINVGLRDVGGHIGFRYYFNNGIGLFTEGQFVIEKYTNTIESNNRLNNQFAVLAGLTFDLHHEPN
ncbi:DUF6646 family protein [Halpernia frigidisoli]|uniref:Outer membrane protein beta-barrel domain-containing protein n=1 Tax=Halpernia frigidisoli TaxID=1125876 RepID=A0A1I3HLN7_9FLAO|nr:DUF6646 family protein [Halpernia frigidisoli]SFI36688.1 hypothetical protein SAMN05443292_2282 [Halpernia frigidisoli]